MFGKLLRVSIGHRQLACLYCATIAPIDTKQYQESSAEGTFQAQDLFRYFLLFSNSIVHCGARYSTTPAVQSTIQLRFVVTSTEALLSSTAAFLTMSEGVQSMALPGYYRPFFACASQRPHDGTRKLSIRETSGENWQSICKIAEKLNKFEYVIRGVLN